MTFDQIRGAIDDLARPFAIYALPTTCAVAVLDGGLTADKLGAAGIILSVLVGTRSLDNQAHVKATAEVDKVKGGGQRRGAPMRFAGIASLALIASTAHAQSTGSSGPSSAQTAANNALAAASATKAAMRHPRPAHPS